MPNFNAAKRPSLNPFLVCWLILWAGGFAHAALTKEQTLVAARIANFTTARTVGGSSQSSTLALGSGTISGGADEDTKYWHIPGSGKNLRVVTLSYDFFDVPDSIDVYYEDEVIFSTGSFVSGGSGPRPLLLVIPQGRSNVVQVVINQGGNSDSGTAWEYRLDKGQDIGITLHDIKDDDEIIPKNGTAYISGDSAPRMPVLVAELSADLPPEYQDTPVEWSMSVTSVAHRKRRDDRNIPGPRHTDTHTLRAADQWTILEDLPAELFFGGNCTLTVKLPKPFVSRLVLKFRIRGQNPSEDDITSYLSSAGAPYYALPIGYVESTLKQFYPSDRFLGRKVDPGAPIWGSPDGWGILQVDGKDGTNVDSTMAWNWQASIDGGLHKMTVTKVKESNASFDRLMKYDTYVDPPTVEVYGVTYDPFDADIIIRYNGGKAFTFKPKAADPDDRWVFRDNKYSYLHLVTAQYLKHGGL